MDPEHQGEGIGAGLVECGLKRVDRDGLPCYVETHDERNLRFYEANGFELASSELVPGSDLRFWCYLSENQATIADD